MAYRNGFAEEAYRQEMFRQSTLRAAMDQSAIMEQARRDAAMRAERDFRLAAEVAEAQHKLAEAAERNRHAEAQRLADIAAARQKGEAAEWAAAAEHRAREIRQRKLVTKKAGAEKKAIELVDEAKAQLGLNRFSIAERKCTDALSVLSANKIKDGAAIKRVYYNRGLSYIYLREFTAAVKDFDAVARLDALDVDALYCRGMANCYLGNLQAAVNDFQATLALDPDHFCAKIYLFYSQGNYESMNRIAHSIIARENGMRLREKMLIRALLGIANHNLACHGEALSHYTQAVEFLGPVADLESNKPELERIHCLRGYTLEAMGRRADAVRDYTAAHALNPDNPLYLIPDAEAAADNSVKRAANYKIAMAYYNGSYAIPRDYQKAYQSIQAAATLGHTEAQYIVAKVLHYGAGGIEVNINRAVVLYAAAAQANHAEAAFNLAEIYQNGPEPLRDLAEARRYYQQASDLEFAKADYPCALSYKDVDHVVAVRYFGKVLARQEDENRAKAAFYLGEIYRRGEHGGAVDLARARAYYKIAADLNYQDAYMPCADLHYGVDNTVAALYYKKALSGQVGQAKAEVAYRLGEIYRHGGHGVVFDKRQSQSNYKIAAELDYAEAYLPYADLCFGDDNNEAAKYYKKLVAIVPVRPDRAALAFKVAEIIRASFNSVEMGDYYRIAAERNYQDAFFPCAEAHNGNNNLLAAEYYLKVRGIADHPKKAESAYQLGKLYAEGGHGLAVNGVRARENFTIASSLDYRSASADMDGSYYYHHTTSPLAITRLTAVSSSDPAKYGIACLYLGRIYENASHGAAKDLAQAKIWYKKGMEVGNGDCKAKYEELNSWGNTCAVM